MDSPARRRPSSASVIMIAAMFGVICAMLSAALAPTTYRAAATAFVGRPGVTLLADRGRPASFEAQVEDSYSRITTTPVVLDPVIERLGLDTTAARLARRIEVEHPSGTSLLVVTASDQQPAAAAAIANAVVRQLIVASAGLQPRTADAAPTVVLTQVQRAVPPRSPAGLPLPLVVLLGLASGGGIAAAALLIAWVLRRRPPPGGRLAPSMFSA